jgi:predicted DNA-binding transcriptional regulator AlpA
MARSNQQQKEKASPRLALTIDEFCKAFGISRSLYYILRRQGLGPREMRFGVHIVISMEAADQWRREHEGNAK